MKLYGADDENRTRTISLGSSCSTTKLHLHILILYKTKQIVKKTSLILIKLCINKMLQIIAIISQL